MFSKHVSMLLFLPLVSARSQYYGMNIAGGDFGCEITGTCPTSSTQLPLTSLGGGDGLGQMQHFVSDDQMNIFRLPVSWQFLVNNNLSGTLDATNFGKYDQLMQACLGVSADVLCVIDIHNFARWNGDIIGQSNGSVTNEHFTSLWTQLATKYASTNNVVFGLMDEPHDLDIALWAATCQEVVTAIRNAGATGQMILLPGTNFASAGQFVSSGSGDELGNVTNADGGKKGLVFDLHKYLDVDNSGTHSTCTTNNIADAFQPVADYLRTNGRQAVVSETGASSDPTCFTDFCAQNAFINANSDVYLGYIAWAAGSFNTSYLLSLTSTKTDGKYVDNALAAQCVVGVWKNASTAVSTAAATVQPTAAVSLPDTSTPLKASTSTGTSAGIIFASLASGVKSGVAGATGTQSPLTKATSLANSTVTVAGSVSSDTTAAKPSSTLALSTGNASPGSWDGAKRSAVGLMAGSLLVAVLL